MTTAEADAGASTLNRHVMTSSNTATGQTVASVAVPAGDSLAMSPDSLDVIVPAKKGKKGWQPGDLVSFTLHFEHSGAVKTLAVVVSPGQGST